MGDNTVTEIKNKMLQCGDPDLVVFFECNTFQDENGLWYRLAEQLDADYANPPRPEGPKGPNNRALLAEGGIHALSVLVRRGHTDATATNAVKFATPSGPGYENYTGA